MKRILDYYTPKPSEWENILWVILATAFIFLCMTTSAWERFLR